MESLSLEWNSGRVADHIGWHLGLGLLAWCTVTSPLYGADCLMLKGDEGPGAPFVRHLKPGCPDRDRNGQVLAADLLAAIRDGRDLDLEGVAVAGDLALDTLPEVPITALPTLPQGIQEVIADRRVQTARVIRGTLTIRHAVFRGSIKTNLRDGLLVALKPLDFSGTRFEQTVDWSQGAFLGPVDFSRAVFLREALFLNGAFAQKTAFDETAFGIHSRFHHARFLSSVSFRRAGFNGLAEFLEVHFAGDANLSRTYFKQGTGFSGSRFGGMLDFSEALFEQDAFFTFAVFEKDAYFERATFRGAADFTDADFQRLGDFSKALFEKTPVLTRTKLGKPGPGRGGLDDPRTLYVIAAVLATFTLILLVFLRRG